MLAFGLGSGIAGLAGCASRSATSDRSWASPTSSTPSIVVVAGGVGQLHRGGRSPASDWACCPSSSSLRSAPVISKILILVLVIAFIRATSRRPVRCVERRWRTDVLIAPQDAGCLAAAGRPHPRGLPARRRHRAAAACDVAHDSRRCGPTSYPVTLLASSSAMPWSRWRSDLIFGYTGVSVWQDAVLRLARLCLRHVPDARHRPGRACQVTFRFHGVPRLEEISVAVARHRAFPLAPSWSWRSRNARAGVRLPRFRSRIKGDLLLDHHPGADVRFHVAVLPQRTASQRQRLHRFRDCPRAFASPIRRPRR